ncbi:MAG: sugar ABC transporter permease [Trueperaceae bacterium]
MSQQSLPQGLASQPEAARAPRRSSLLRSRKWWGFAFVLPVVLFFGAFSIFPIAYGFYLSLTDFTLLRSPEWVGARNYVNLWHDGLFQQAVRVTIGFVLGTTVPVWILSLLAALLFFQRFPARGMFKALFFLPVLPSLVVVSIVWKVLLHPDGILTSMVGPIVGMSEINWLNSAVLAPWSMIIVQNWATIPFFMLIWLAGLSGIPTELREAALIDGANRLQAFLRVELPMLRPTAVLVAAVSTIQAFQGFILQYVMSPDKGGPADSTTTLALLIWKYGFQYFRMGEAAAISVILFLIILLVTFLQLVLGRADTPVGR